MLSVSRNYLYVVRHNVETSKHDNNNKTIFFVLLVTICLDLQAPLNYMLIILYFVVVNCLLGQIMIFPFSVRFFHEFCIANIILVYDFFASLYIILCYDFPAKTKTAKLF